MKKWVLLILVISISAVGHAQDQCAGNQLSIVVSCYGRSCQGQYSPGTPYEAGEADYAPTMIQCCGHNVNIWQDVGSCSPGQVKKASISLETYGVHLLVSTCAGNFLPLNEGSSRELVAGVRLTPDLLNRRLLQVAPFLDEGSHR